MGHPLLRQRAREVPAPRPDDLAGLVADMIETMNEVGGIGLAAPQVGESWRLVIFHVLPEDEEDAVDDAEFADGRPDSPAREQLRDQELTVLVNPEIEILDPEREDGWEACLSVPGLCGKVPRYKRIRYRGESPDGKVIEREAEGFHARVVQHECDHLDGVLYPLRMEDLGTLMFSSEIENAGEELPGEETL